MTKEELAKQYADKKVDERKEYPLYDLSKRKELTTFDGYDIEQAYEDGFNNAVQIICEFLKDRIEHDSIDYPMATMYLIDDLKIYVEENKL